MYVRWDKPAEAEAAFDQLKANYSNHPDFSGAVCVIGDNYRWKGIDEKARQMYQIAVEGISPSEAIWAKMGLAITSIRLKDYQTADPLTEQILIDFAGDNRLATACCLIADAYRSTRHHRQAIDLYQHVIDKHGASEYAMWSQMGIAISNIDLRKKDDAQSAIKKLREDYADHPSFYKAVGDIGDNYRWRDIHDKAREMYEVALVGLSGSEVFWPKAGIAIASVHLKDYQTAEAFTKQIRTEFADHTQLPEAICLIAGAYRSMEDHDKALDLYQLILKVWPRNEQALWSKAGMARMAIAVGDEAGGAEAINNMIADFKDHAALPAAVWAVAEEYWEKALLERRQGRHDQKKESLRKALMECERVISQFPETLHTTAEAHHISAQCYVLLGDWEKAFQYYQKIIDDWPDYELASHVQFMIARIYTNLKRSGAIGESDADLLIRDTYETIVENYPDTPPAKAARSWLDYYYRKNQGGENGQAGSNRRAHFHLSLFSRQ